MFDIRAIPDEQLLRMADVAAAHSDLLGSEHALRELHRRSPRNAEVLLALCQNMQAQGAYPEALAVARRAVAVAPKDARSQSALAFALSINGQLEASARAFELAIRLRPDDLGVLAAYGSILERLRRTQEARTLGERVLSLDPGFGPALNLLGQLDAAEDKDEQAESWFQRSIQESRDPQSRATAWHRLGALREKQKRWDDAFEAHDRGNRVQLGTSAARHARTGPAFPHLETTLRDGCEETLARWSGRTFASGPPDPVFLVGFPRSGTTLTEQVLSAIPSTVTTDEEPVLNSARMLAARLGGDAAATDQVAVFDRLTDAQVEEIRAEYWRSVERMIGPQASRAGLFVDKQPLRFVHIALLNAVFPRSRIIFLIRDPRDCCLSCFFQDFAPSGPLARSMSLEGIGELYAEVMTFWLRARAKVTIPVLEMRYEDLVTDFEPNARKLVEFIGREWSDDILRFNEKAGGRAIRTPSYRSVTEKVNTRAIGKWAKYEKHLDPLIERIRPFLGVLGYEE